MTAALLAFAVSILLAAVATSTLLWRRLSATPPGVWERAASVAVTAFSLAIAVNWMLSWLHLLSRGPLLVVALVLAVPSIAYLYRYRTLLSSTTPEVEPWLVLCIAPLVIWAVFVLWRGAILPVLNHDALAYHMPKAVMLARAGHYEFLSAPDPRIPTAPANYELLLADVLLLSGSDALTEWVGTASWIAFLLLGAALVERWWGNGVHVIVTVLLLAATPVILLHSGAHKNDLLGDMFFLAAFFWMARWFVTQEKAPLLLALASLACAAGTKLQAAFPAVAILAVAGWLLARRRLRITRGLVAIVFASAVAALFLFGAWAYVLNLTHAGRIAAPGGATTNIGYGDWNNLWEVPLLLLWRPFDGGFYDVFVPWRGQRWFWPKFELFFSDFGMLTSLLVLALPFAMRRYGRDVVEQTQSERVLASVAALIAFIVAQPVRVRPLGFFAGCPRYLAFIVVIILGWTVAPFVKNASRPIVVKTIALAAAALFVVTAVFYTVLDAFQPFAYVLYVNAHRETRRPFFAGYRAASVADEIAGPNDTVAIHAGFDSWTYPLYGRTLQRKVLFIEPNQPIPPQAQWVLVDRAWNIIWGHPKFEHMGQHRQYLVEGQPSAEDVAVLRELAADKQHFELVYYNRKYNQAVFKRRP